MFFVIYLWGISSIVGGYMLNDINPLNLVENCFLVQEMANQYVASKGLIWNVSCEGGSLLSCLCL